ncbi:MAG: hypothetical protein H7250_04525 [Flavobacterium sp.]|nr:hypothetical protein [Flavobacterium sp.]
MNILSNFVFQNSKKVGVPELKNKILNQMDFADEKILRIVSSVFDNYYNELETPEDAIKELLKLSEKEYNEGKTELFQNILNESKEKYFGK